MIKNKLWLLILLFGVFSGGMASAEKQVFEYTGADQTFTVPEGVTEITVKVWGAGGGGADDTHNPTVYGQSRGGAGGFTTGTLTVTPGDDLLIVVGEGGKRNTTQPTYGGGGAGGNCGWVSNCLGNSGGGLSGVFDGAFTQGDALIIAGAGGGAADSAFNNYGHGGAGGGLVGFDGHDGDASNPGTFGLGASQTAGGAGGVGTGEFPGGEGEALSGGSGADGNTGGGGGGGAGYFGGGGSSSSHSGFDAGGGGGSGYCAPSVDDCDHRAGDNGASDTQSAQPGGFDDPDYQTGVGMGNFQGDGGNGLVVIEWEGAVIEIDVIEEGDEVIEITCTEDCEHDFDGDLSRLCVNLVCNADSPEVITATLNFSSETITKEKQCDKVPPTCTATFWGPDEWHRGEDFDPPNPLECLLESYEDTTGEALELNNGEDDEEVVEDDEAEDEAECDAPVCDLERVELIGTATAAVNDRLEIQCPAGKKAVSGGCFSGSHIKNIIHNYPMPGGDGWVCNFNQDVPLATNTSGGNGVYAVCGVVDESYEIVIDEGTVANTLNDIREVSCPAGKKLTGGGCATGSGSYDILHAYPKNGGDTFHCNLNQDDGTTLNGNGFYNAYAICTDPNPGYEIVSNQEQTTTDVNNQSEVDCPADKVLLGGGCFNGSSNFALGHFIPDDGLVGFNCSYNQDSPANPNAGMGLTSYAICAEITTAGGGGGSDTQCLLEPGSQQVIDPLEPIHGDICTFEVCDKSGNCSTCDSPELKYDDTPICSGGENGGIGKTADGTLCGECAADDDDCHCIRGDAGRCRDDGPINCYTNPFHDRCPGFQNPACLIDPFTPGCPVVNPCYPVVMPGAVCPKDAERFCARNPYHYGCNVACGSGAIDCDPMPPGVNP